MSVTRYVNILFEVKSSIAHRLLYVPDDLALGSCGEIVTPFLQDLLHDIEV